MSKFTKADDLYRAILKLERGLKCEICGKPQDRLSHPLSVFHILDKGTHPRLRYHRDNTLLSCWTNYESKACHNIFHSSGHGDWTDRRREEIKSIIAKLKGYPTWEELKEHLWLVERVNPRVDPKLVAMCLKQQLTTQRED